MFRAPPSTVRAALARLRGAASAAVFIDLRLSWIQQREQSCIVRIIRVVDDGVEEIRRGDGSAGGEVRGVAGEDRDRVGAVLQQMFGIEYEIDARNAGVSEREVTAASVWNPSRSNAAYDRSLEPL